MIADQHAQSRVIPVRHAMRSCQHVPHGYYGGSAKHGALVGVHDACHHGELVHSRVGSSHDP